jgi:type VI secretion system protein VasG
MAEFDREVTFGKLNELSFRTLESAESLCRMRGNPYVELVHWLKQMLEARTSDAEKIIQHFGLNLAKLASDITAALDTLPRGSTTIMDLSEHLDMVVQRAWVFGSLMYNAQKIRTGHLILAMLKTPQLRNLMLAISPEFKRIGVDKLQENFTSITEGSEEEKAAVTEKGPAGANVGGAEGTSPGATPGQSGKSDALARFTVDLTDKAKKGELDPILGRDEEIRQMVDILMRRRQNNPIMVGEAGVGKTAVVEGFAQRIAAGDVPPPLKDVSVRALDLGLLQAGASVKGEFEQRLRNVIDEVQRSKAKPIILFIDEAHTLVGAGGQAGTGDAANLLKPALARGTLRTIAATTWAEYKKYFEKDPALTRRFQTVKVDEPSEAKTLLMLRGLASVQEKHHQVQILDEALDAAARLSHRYIPDRQLPDKAVSLLDTACARVAVGQHSVPAEVEDSRRRIQAMETELGILDREETMGSDHTERRALTNKKLDEERGRLKELEDHWKQERDVVTKILDLRATLRKGGEQKIDQPAAAVSSAAASGSATAVASAASGSGNGASSSSGGSATAVAEPPSSASASSASAASSISTETTVGLNEQQRKALLSELRSLQGRLAELQGDSPLILPSVDAQAIAAVVADWTGIPVGRMVKNEIEAVLKLGDTLEKRVIGQRHALDTIARRIQTSRAGMDNPSRPVGVFMLVGPSGVGKTETALALAESLYGGEQNVITINMSEFQEAHTVSTLKGAPPGYVGYGEGGVLTEAVRRRPYSVVLLDEVEKAHSDVHEIFFQVFDKGMMEDGEGRLIDFKNTIILLTSNVGSDLIMNMCKDPELMPDAEGLAKAVREPLRQVFPAALLGRLVVVPYYPISDTMLKLITRLQLGRIAKRVGESRQIPFTYDDAIVDLVASRCTEAESGARAVDAILTHTLLPRISMEFLTRLASNQPVKKVHIGRQETEFTYSFE